MANKNIQNFVSSFVKGNVSQAKSFLRNALIEKQAKVLQREKDKSRKIN